MTESHYLGIARAQRANVVDGCLQWANRVLNRYDPST